MHLLIGARVPRLALGDVPLVDARPVDGGKGQGLLCRGAYRVLLGSVGAVDISAF